MRKPEGVILGKYSIFGNVNPADFGVIDRSASTQPTPPAPRTAPYNPPPSKGKLRLPVIKADGQRDCMTCPAPCCSVLIAEVTRAEAESGKWQCIQAEDGKFYLDRPYGRCAHLDAQNRCTTYLDRPAVCINYRCDGNPPDDRITKWFLKNCE